MHAWGQGGILNRRSGPGCIKQLKIKLEFLQPFPVLRINFLARYYGQIDRADERALETQERCEKIFQNTRNSCRNSHVILSCFMQPGPGGEVRMGRSNR